MFSQLNSLFYVDIDLHDWEEMLATLRGESVITVTDEAKELAWQDIKQRESYEDVDKVSGIYASKLVDAMSKVIAEQYPNISLSQDINCLMTSFSVDGCDVHDYTELQEVLFDITGRTKCLDILNELNDSEFNDLEDAECHLIQSTGVVGDMRAATSFLSFIFKQEVSDEDLAGVYHYDNCPKELRHAIALALQVKRFIDDNTKFCDTEVTVVENTVQISCDVHNEGFFEIESITDLWEVLAIAKVTD